MDDGDPWGAPKKGEKWCLYFECTWVLPYPFTLYRAVKFIICQWMRSHTACAEMPSMTVVAKNIYTEKLNRLFVSSAHICARQSCRKHIWNVVAMLCHKTWFQAWTKMCENICCVFLCIATLCSHGDVRLVGGYTDHEGRVEVCINGILGTCLLQWMEYHKGFGCVQAAVWRKH